MRDVLIHDSNGNRAIVTDAVYFSDSMSRAEDTEFPNSRGAVKIPAEVIRELSSTELCSLIESAAMAIPPVVLESKISHWEMDGVSHSREFLESIDDLASRLSEEQWSILSDSTQKLVRSAQCQLRCDPDTAGRRRRRELKSNDKSCKTSGYIYLAKSDTGHYKIGRSKTPEDRVEHFNTKMPVEVKMIYFFGADDYKEAEKRLHDKYDESRETGEWFNLTAGQVADIQSIARFEDDGFTLDYS